MSDIQIPNLPVAISLSGAEQLECVQSGVSRRVTVAQIQNNITTGAFELMLTEWFLTLPTSLPGTPDTWWNDGGTLAYTS